jgi:hypothetical protein
MDVIAGLEMSGKPVHIRNPDKVVEEQPCASTAMERIPSRRHE